jgi:hypothetical protein
MSVSDKKMLYEPLQENKYSNISKNKYSSDSKINVKISSCAKHSVNSKERMWVTTVAMQHGIRAKLGAEQPCFPFIGKPNLEDLSNLPEYSKLFCTT